MYLSLYAATLRALRFQKKSFFGFTFQYIYLLKASFFKCPHVKVCILNRGCLGSIRPPLNIQKSTNYFFFLYDFLIIVQWKMFSVTRKECELVLTGCN